MSTSSSSSLSITNNVLTFKAIDSHLHTWGDGIKGDFKYFENNNPPPDLRTTSDAEDLLAEMNNSGVSGALIVQPINYKYDHSYLLNILNNENYKGVFKGMCLLDPKADESYLPKMKELGFSGVRFNPYLWKPEENDGNMSDERGIQFFKQCAALQLPVGIMCFKGLKLHYSEIITMLDSSPSTIVILDHFGFFFQNGNVDEESFGMLLSLAKYQSVHIKISALFRNSATPPNYEDLNDRLKSLIDSFGADRLLWGTDYPYVNQHCGYTKGLTAIQSWDVFKTLSDDQKFSIFRGTTEKLFGKFEK